MPRRRCGVENREASNKENRSYSSVGLVLDLDEASPKFRNYFCEV